jgi:hypothetical protein
MRFTLGIDAHPRRAARDPLMGAALTVRLSRSGGAPRATTSFAARHAMSR